jgi:putative acetyltransferase
MVAVRFREADVSDAQTLWWTKQAAIDEIETDEYTEAELRAWKPDGEAVADFERAIESGTFTILIAEVDSETAGYGVLNHQDGRIDAVFVHPDHGGQGIATSLVRQLETRAQMHGISGLTIVSSLNALSFYESLGYRKSGHKTRTIDSETMEFAIVEKGL